MLGATHVVWDAIKNRSFHAPGGSDGFEWPILIVIVLIILIVAGLSVLVCLCMKKEADDEKKYRAMGEEEQEKMDKAEMSAKDKE